MDPLSSDLLLTGVWVTLSCFVVREALFYVSDRLEKQDRLEAATWVLLTSMPFLLGIFAGLILIIAGLAGC